jgi:hypothetical protein
MTATYEPTLPSDKDWVRFLVGDRDLTDPALQDEEIDAALLIYPNKWIAAANLGQRILDAGAGAVSKSVGDLSISYGGLSETAFSDHLKKLQERGAAELLKQSGSSVLRNL